MLTSNSLPVPTADDAAIISQQLLAHIHGTDTQYDFQGGVSSDAHRSRQRESYTVRDKIAMVKKFLSVQPPISIRRFSVQYGIPSNTFKHWISTYENGVPEDLNSLESQSRRRIRPGKFPAVENKVIEFLKARDLANEGKIDAQSLKEKCDAWAKECLTEKEIEDFKVTPSWLQRVMRRHSLNNVDGIEVTLATGADHDPTVLAASSSAIPDETDIQNIVEKFLSRKRQRDPNDEEEADENMLSPRASGRRGRPSNSSRRASTNNNTFPLDAEGLEFSPSVHGTSGNLPSSLPLLVYDPTVPVPLDQALHALTIALRFTEEQQLTDIGQLLLQAKSLVQLSFAMNPSPSSAGDVQQMTSNSNGR